MTAGQSWMQPFDDVPIVVRPRDRLRPVGIVLLVIALVAGVGGSAVLAGSGTSFYPKQWDARLAPIAAVVARLRRLEFKHPVSARFLDDAAFEKTLGVDPGNIGASARSELENAAAVLRALGLLGGTDDLLQSTNTQEKSTALAFYDEIHKVIVVRGSTLDAEHDVTIAHELTHVLQDQHFDLTKLSKRAIDSTTGDSAAFKAIVEGDASHVEDEYLKGLPKAKRDEYAREETATRTTISPKVKSVPQIIQLLSEAPYAFGPYAIRALIAASGERGVDEALTGPVPSSLLFVQPGDLTPPIAVPAPTRPADATQSRPVESFGPFELYLMLALRIAPARALESADVVSGGTAITYKRNGINCYRVAIATSSTRRRAFVVGALRDWARGHRRVTVTDAGRFVEFTACDSGRSTPGPSKSQVDTLVELLVVRSELVVDGLEGGSPQDLARCVGRVFVQDSSAEKLVLAVGNTRPTPQQTSALRAAAERSGRTCVGNSEAGLP